jgi:hypothetical protein
MRFGALTWIKGGLLAGAKPKWRCLLAFPNANIPERNSYRCFYDSTLPNSR